jgi:uncharacterized membrane protein
MLERSILKQFARDRLKGKWGTGAAITFVQLLIAGLFAGLGQIQSIQFIPPFANIFIIPVLNMGIFIVYVSLIKNNTFVFGEIFSGFKIYLKALGVYWWMMLWTFLWFLLLIIPGIIKAISYSQAIFIIADNPNVRIRDALKISMKMTDGYKTDIFVMGLSFIGWALLSVLTLFIGLFWLVPYINATYAAMYFRLKELSIQNGKCTEDMFTGTTSIVH